MSVSRIDGGRRSRRFAAITGAGAALLGVWIIGCAGATGSAAQPNPYAGQYEGTLSGDAAAAFTVTVDTKGKVTGTLTDGLSKQMSGTVNEVGTAAWMAAPPTPEAEVTYLLDGSCDSSGCGGTWLGTTGLSGSWSCDK